MEWFTETLYPSWQQRLGIEAVLYQERTEHQDLVVFRSSAWGTVLALDGVVQTTTGDEWAYHEMLVHPSLIAHGRARSVCIVGGGDGGTLREVVKQESINRVVMAELDPGVIEFCKKHLPGLSNGSFDDPRLELRFGDAAVYMAMDDEKFDTIIVDSTDPHGPGAALFTQSFYEDCRRKLNDGGILITQCGVPSVQPDELGMTQHRQRAAGFGDVSFYLTCVPTYVGGMMALGWASDDTTRRKVRVDTLMGRPIPKGLRYYSPEVHVAAFAHPLWMEALANKT